MATPATTPDFTTIKQRQQQVRATGDYAAAATAIYPMAGVLYADVGLTAEQRVLYVARGNGSAALAAARRRAQVLGVDYVPELLERAPGDRVPGSRHRGSALSRRRHVRP